MMSAAANSLPEPPRSEATNFLNLLIIDDEQQLRELCSEVAQSLGFTVLAVDSAEHAYRMIESVNIDAALLHLHLSEGGALETLHQIKQLRPETLIAVVARHGSVQAAVEAMKCGAYDYLTKPYSVLELKNLLQRVATHFQLKTENRVLRERIKSSERYGPIIGHAPEMQKLYRVIAKAAQSVHPVLILGESGTGKEMVARAIHQSGPLREKPFIPVDCGSLVPTLIESELFGYVKGAFTGAHQAKEGLLAIARGGTVFLDEIGELSVDLQAKLLRAIQEKEIRPVGSIRPISIHVRVLAATNRDLGRAVLQGSFRRDLFFRLNVLTLHIPPLRERREDVPLLSAHFLDRLARASGVERSISDDALQAMLSYDWPGNVRELENCLERSFVLTSGPVIHKADLPPEVAGHALPTSIASPGRNEIRALAEVEKHAILAAINDLHGNKLEAARRLGIGKTTLYRKLKGYAASTASGATGFDSSRAKVNTQSTPFPVAH